MSVLRAPLSGQSAAQLVVMSSMITRYFTGMVLSTRRGTYRTVAIPQ